MKRLRSFGVLSFGKSRAVFHGFPGFIFGLIATAFANLALKLTGGLELEIED